MTILIALVAGCGTDNNSSQASGDALRTKLSSLPFKYTFHEVPHTGSGDVIGGTATDRNGRSVDFVLSIGDTRYEDPGERSADGTVVNRGGGKNFGWWIDSNRKAPRQVALARNRIAEGLVQALCRSASGAPCGV
jgi:hypothetical protein